MLGHTFASLRGDRVVALDGNPEKGYRRTIALLERHYNLILLDTAPACSGQHLTASLQLIRNVNAVREEGLVEVDKIKEHFQGRCRAGVQVPWDPHLSAGAETQVDRLRPVTQRAYLEVAAAVADGFTA
jgi:hypothetical protein